jgi:hypothetical protein
VRLPDALNREDPADSVRLHSHSKSSRDRNLELRRHAAEQRPGEVALAGDDEATAGKTPDEAEQ